MRDPALNTTYGARGRRQFPPPTANCHIVSRKVRDLNWKIITRSQRRTKCSGASPAVATAQIQKRAEKGQRKSSMPCKLVSRRWDAIYRAAPGWGLDRVRIWLWISIQALQSEPRSEFPLKTRGRFRADLKLDSDLLFVKRTAPKSSKGQFEKTAGLALD